MRAELCCGPSLPLRSSGAVAALVFLAAAAPARVVAADVAVLVRDRLRRGQSRRRRAGAGHGRRTRCRGSGDRLGPGSGLVLVEEVAVAVLRLLLQRLRLDPHLGMEEREHDLLADRLAQLLEHLVALGPVLDERVLLREGAQMDALAPVVHRLEVLAPALADDRSEER